MPALYVGKWKIKVFNSKDYTKQAISDLFYTHARPDTYKHYYPKILGRDTDKEWQIYLSPYKPRRSFYTALSGFISRYFDSECDEISSVKRKYTPPLKFALEEIEAMQNRISEELVQAIRLIMNSGNFFYPYDFIKSKHFQNFTHQEVSFFRKGYLNSKYFQKLNDWSFELKPDHQPSLAIRSLFESPSIIDCGNAVTIAYYKALLEIAGDEKFDTYFANNPHGRLTIEIAPVFSNILADFCSLTHQAKYLDAGREGNRPLEIGDMCSFIGVPFYGNKHPDGSEGSYNVIYAGLNQKGEQVSAHGFENFLAEGEIYQLFIDAYNQERTEGDCSIIASKGYPIAYDEKEHFFLKKFYTIKPVDIAHCTLKGFIEGYWHSITRRLPPKLVLTLLKSSDISLLQRNLKLREIYRKYEINSGTCTHYNL